MKKSVWLVIGLAVIVPGLLEAAEFDFYGIKFGMEKKAVEKIFKMDSQIGAACSIGDFNLAQDSLP